MNGRNNNNSFSPGVFLVIAAAVLLFNVVGKSDASPAALLLVLLPIAAVAAIGLGAYLFRSRGKSFDGGKIKKSLEEMKNSPEKILEYFNSRDMGVEDMPSETPHFDGSALYNERAAEENFLRDRQRRIKQLDSFLKNGFIDRAEYNLLKKHYESDVYER